MINKKAFSLSEVLVTLSILGVLMVILIPNLFAAKPENNIVMLKKAYSVLERTISELVNNDAAYPGGLITDSADTPSVKVWKGFSDTLSGTPADTPPGGLIPANTDKFCYLFSQELSTAGTPDCSYSGTPRTGSFTTTDGIVWSIPLPADFTPVSRTSYKQILIDINGPSKQPNCGDTGDSSGFTACPAGVMADKFHLGVRYDGKISITDANAAKILLNPTVNQKGALDAL